MEKTDNKTHYMYAAWDGFIKENPDFCNANPDDVTLPYIEAKNLNQENTNAHHMLKAIIKKEVDEWNNKNEGTNFPDWKNYGQAKFYPIADMDPSSGSGVAFTDYDYWRTGTGCGSRLCTPTREICKGLFTKYYPIYEVSFCK